MRTRTPQGTGRTSAGREVRRGPGRRYRVSLLLLSADGRADAPREGLGTELARTVDDPARAAPLAH